MRTWRTTSNLPEETESIAEKIGARLKGGETIELVSDLGGGKTAFVRGLARGMGSKDMVGSPTFTISREYKAGDKTLYHFDFYRLNQPGIITDELAEVVGDSNSVVAVEWPDSVQQVLPKKRLTIKFSITGEKNRALNFTFPKDVEYLLGGVIPPSSNQIKKRNSK